MLGRLVVPAADLDAVGTLSAQHLPTGNGAPPWRVSVLSADTGADVSRVDAFNQRHADPAHGAAVVDAIETRVSSADDIRALRAWATRGFDVYCEVPLGSELDPVLDAVAQAGLHAKLRTGGPPPPARRVATMSPRSCAGAWHVAWSRKPRPDSTTPSLASIRPGRRRMRHTRRCSGT